MRSVRVRVIWTISPGRVDIVRRYDILNHDGSMIISTKMLYTVAMKANVNKPFENSIFDPL